MDELQPRLVTEADAAKYIGMSRDFLRKSRCEGNLKGRTPAPPFIRTGARAVRYDLRDLDAWIDENRRDLNAFKGAA